MSLLEVHDLAIARGGMRVIEGVSFKLNAGGVLALRGANGIGKTSLLRCISGLQSAVEGQVEMASDSVAYAAHEDGLKSVLSVADNLRFWASVFGTVNIDRALDTMNLRRLATRPAGALSAGQKRRLGLARLLVTGRRLWVLDEPTVSLDADSVALFVRAVRDHLRGGGAALIATHIDLSLPEAEVLDLTAFRASPDRARAGSIGFNEAFI